MEPLWPKSDQVARVAEVRRHVATSIAAGDLIPFENCPVAESAVRGIWDTFQYQFEGEEDLLHVIVERCDGRPLTVEEGQSVATVVLEGVPSGLVRLTPGTHSHHFYLGHEDFLRAVTGD